MKVPLNQRLVAFVDTETTGLSPTDHEIIDFACILETRTAGVQEVSFKMKPEHLDRASPKALEVNGYTPEKWERAWNQAEGATAISQALKGAVLIGHNVRFDAGFLNATQERHNIKERLDYHLVDTVSLAWIHLVPCGLTSLSLENVCRFLNIDNTDAHTALGDARRCREVYRKLQPIGSLSRLRWKLSHG